MGANLQAHQELAWVKLTDLHIDPIYSRQINPTKVRKIVNEFDPDSIGAIIVSKRSNGSLYILDGCHRVEALREMGWGDQLVPASVMTDLSVEAEARIFTVLNEQRTKPRPTDLYRSKLAAGDERIVDIERIVKGLDLHIVAGPHRDGIQAVSTLENVYRNAAAPQPTLYVTLWTLKRAWGGIPNSFPSSLIMGLALVYNRYEVGPSGSNHNIPERMVGTLRHEDDANQWVENFRKLKSATGRTGSLGTVIAPALLHERYNRNRRVDILPEWDERAGKSVWRTVSSLNGD